MDNEQPNNPLHGVSLKAMLEDLVERRGWEDLAGRIRVRCFAENPSVASSLKFLRKTDWARLKVEQLYLDDVQEAARNRKRNQRRAAMRAVRAEHEAAQAATSDETADIVED
jgi:uncharacterized protein (DUF2132 family)